MTATKIALICFLALSVGTGCQSSRPSASRRDSQPSRVYREGSSTTYYVYDEDFVRYFGSNGIAVVEAAFREFERQEPAVLVQSAPAATASWTPRYDLIDTRPQPQIQINELEK